MPERIAPDKLNIVLYPDPVLRTQCRRVVSFDGDLAGLAARMLDLMHQAQGVGLAAPQVGIDLRLFVCNPTGQPGDDLVCINPDLSELTGAEEKEEGCLSIPNVTVPVRRATRLQLNALDIQGRPFAREATELLARIVQHETDHLNGRLILDYMSEAVAIANRRVLKQLQEDYKKKSA